MATVDLEDMTLDEIVSEIRAGSKFVMYKYCVSVVILTFQQPSGIHLVRAHQSRVVHGLSYTFISLFAGWWGFPWGPIYTIGALFTNLGGGKDLTDTILASVQNQLYQQSRQGQLDVGGYGGPGEQVTEMPRIRV